MPASASSSKRVRNTYLAMGLSLTDTKGAMSQLAPRKAMIVHAASCADFRIVSSVAAFSRTLRAIARRESPRPSAGTARQRPCHRLSRAYSFLLQYLRQRLAPDGILTHKLLYEIICSLVEFHLEKSSHFFHDVCRLSPSKLINR